MKKFSNSAISAANAYKCHFAVALITLINFAPLATAYPGNRERYDCYRKRDNQFSFGSPNNVSNRTILCTLNPNYKPGRGSSQQRNTSTRSNTRRSYKKVYRNNYRNRNYTGERIAIGLGSFAVGVLIGDALWGWVGWGGDIIIDDSINVIGDIGDVEIGDIGDLDDSIEDLDLTADFAGDDFGGDDFSGMDDFGGDDFGGDDFGSMDDFGGDDFGGDDFGGMDDFGAMDDFGGMDDFDF